MKEPAYCKYTMVQSALPNATGRNIFRNRLRILMVSRKGCKDMSQRNANLSLGKGKAVSILERNLRKSA